MLFSGLAAFQILHIRGDGVSRRKMGSRLIRSEEHLRFEASEAGAGDEKTAGASSANRKGRGQRPGRAEQAVGENVAAYF
jgi:hypothetical protein